MALVDSLLVSSVRDPLAFGASDPKSEGVTSGAAGGWASTPLATGGLKRFAPKSCCDELSAGLKLKPENDRSKHHNPETPHLTESVTVQNVPETERVQKLKN